MTAVDVSTRIVRLDQALPPFPDDPEISNTRESHSPIVLGADIATVGDIAEAELVMFTLVFVVADAQVVVSHELTAHCALTTAPVTSLMLLPIRAHDVLLLTYAFTCKLLTQLQVAVLEQAKLNSAPQGNCVGNPSCPWQNRRRSVQRIHPQKS